MDAEEKGTRDLDSFDPAERRRALARLAATRTDAARPTALVNMHCHSFFSYNARGFSPSHIAWEAHQAGLYAAGLCDFDVLDGLDEFLDAGPILGLRVTVNLETRAFLKEYADAEINSPGEPGVTYIMGAGFVRLPAAGTPAAATLEALRAQAGDRNRALVQRINRHMGKATIDYAKHVVPLSPGGCPTERHIVRAYVSQSRALFRREADLAQFWAGLFGCPAEEVIKLLPQGPAFEERVRSRLVKRGGVGYEQPTVKTFPLAADFVKWVLSCNAIPVVTWLDGTSKGESDPIAMLRCLQNKGAAAVNIIPDRNWNVSDPTVRAMKTAKLREFVEAAESLHMPVNIGTEMNRDGLPFVDDLQGEALRPFRETFLRGAQVMVGHSILARYAGFPYTSAAAKAEFGSDTAAKNRFFAAVGALPPLTRDVADRLEKLGLQEALEYVRRSTVKGAWGNGI